MCYLLPHLFLHSSYIFYQLFYKRDLLRRCYDEDIPEPWVQCDACELWFHQPCALYNKVGAMGVLFVCMRTCVNERSMIS